MSKLPDHAEPMPPNRQPSSANRPIKSGAQAVTPKEYFALASFLAGRDSVQRVHKKDAHGEALRTTGELVEKREYVAAYECLKPVYDKVVSDMQRILARNLEFEANKLSREQRTPLAVAKTNIQKMKAYAQQVIDQFDRLLHDLESKPLVRNHIKKGRPTGTADAPPTEEAQPTTLASADETRLDAVPGRPLEIVSGDRRYTKAPYAPPEMGTLYSVRDKAGRERIIRVIGKSPDGTLVQVETLEAAEPSKQPIQLTVDSLTRQAAKGWCSLLLPVAETEDAAAAADQAKAPNAAANTTMRLDSQNFGRCCAVIARAKINYSTQLIKDVGDGPFRAGHFEKAFLTFEQLAVGFTSAVASSRRAIADGRRALTAEKGKLSGKEIQERNAAFIRNEQQINAAEREFSTILEGLRMYLSAR
jgi:hypothetical protein